MHEVTEIEVNPSLINVLAKKKEVAFDWDKYADSPENFINLKSNTNTQSTLAIREGKLLRHLETRDLNYQGWTPRDREQNCYFWSLKNKQATFCLGAAGTGKTSIAIAYGIQNIFRKERPLILCKPTIFVGSKSNAIAAVPGNERDKLAPYMDSYMPSLKKILGRDYLNFVYEWEEKELLNFRAIELIRGQHFENCTLIIDEAQNLSLHELVSVLSRVGQGGTAIVLGDPAQIDTQASWRETGLCRMLESKAVKESSLTACIKLKKQYRGPLADLCQKVLEENWVTYC
tara:strand:- start:456 stop:1319 length:864 start_codon:yes stop_codon:yes gene_type:complete